MCCFFVNKQHLWLDDEICVGSLLDMGGLFHEKFPRFHYFHIFFKQGRIFIDIAMKVRCNIHENIF